MRSESTPPQVEIGLYRSSKGHDYWVSNVALEVTNSTPEGQWKVHYREEPQRFIGGVAIWCVRDYTEFTEQVPDPDHPGQTIPRFTKLKEQDNA